MAGPDVGGRETGTETETENENDGEHDESTHGG